MAGSPPSSRSWLARAAASAGPVKALAGAAVAVIGLLASWSRSSPAVVVVAAASGQPSSWRGG